MKSHNKNCLVFFIFLVKSIRIFMAIFVFIKDFVELLRSPLFCKFATIIFACWTGWWRWTRSWWTAAWLGGSQCTKNSNDSHSKNCNEFHFDLIYIPRELIKKLKQLMIYIEKQCFFIVSCLDIRFLFILSNSYQQSFDDRTRSIKKLFWCNKRDK